MKTFEALFGVSPSKICKTCVIMPSIHRKACKAFRVDKIIQGMLFSVGSNGSFSLIGTGMGAAFAGDAVLYLKDTCCENIIHFGSCGLINAGNGLDIGSLVCPAKCYPLESFSDCLSIKDIGDSFLMPSEEIHKSISDPKYRDIINSTVHITMGSLKLEPDHSELLSKKHIQTVDMECSAVFSAADSSGLKAASVMYATDIIGYKPFFRQFSEEEKQKISASVTNGARIICDLAKNL